MSRLTLFLPETTDWPRYFDPRGGSVFVPTSTPPPVGQEVRVDLTITDGGPRVILKGAVLWSNAVATAEAPAGCTVGLSVDNREKVNYLNGFVRGGLLNLRERRRLPVRLPVTFGGLEGPQHTYTRDLNEEGTFVVSDAPLMEGTIVHCLIGIPGRQTPVQVRGTVVHTVIVEDEDIPGMGIRFDASEAEHADLKKIVDGLEEAFLHGRLPEEVIT